VLFGLGFVEINLLITIRLPQRRLSRQSFGKYWKLNQQQPKDRTHTNAK